MTKKIFFAKAEKSHQAVLILLLQANCPAGGEGRTWFQGGRLGCLTSWLGSLRSAFCFKALTMFVYWCYYWLSRDLLVFCWSFPGFCCCYTGFLEFYWCILI